MTAITDSEDRKELLLLQEKYQNVLERDALTGVYNRRGFYSHTYDLLHTHEDIEYDICCFNIDKFKVINDLFGTFAGDKLLNYVASKLIDYVGDRGTMARLTADNFAICVPHTDNLYEEIPAFMKEIADDYPLVLNIVIRSGFYFVHDRDIAVSLMCDRANMAILEIKGNFEKNYFIYDDSIRNRILEEQEIVNEMKDALDDGQFTVYYQPKVNMESGKVIGSEALVRWIHPEKGIISPGVFIPIFEKNGFISSLDRYVWECVCQDIREWIKAGYTALPVSINVSRAELYNKDLSDLFTSLVNKYEIPIDLLQLEITESAYTDNPDQLIDIVNDLKSMGFTILMDDFGSGYSSLNTLKDVCVDVLKLDLKFLYNMDQNKKANYILKSVVQMAKRLNLHVIAEGVETESQAEFLKSIGCVRAQGYLYARPMPKADFEKYISDPKKVSANDTDKIDGLVTIDDVLAGFHREDELEWYRSAVIQMKALMFEYDFDSDVFMLYDMQLEEDSRELSRMEIPYFSKVSLADTIIRLEDGKNIVYNIENHVSNNLDMRINMYPDKPGFRWFRQEGRILYTEEGEPKSYVGVLRNIDEEKADETLFEVMSIFENEGFSVDSLRMAFASIIHGYVSKWAGICVSDDNNLKNNYGLAIGESGYLEENFNYDQLKMLNNELIGLDYSREGLFVINESETEKYSELIRHIFFRNNEKTVVIGSYSLGKGLRLTTCMAFDRVVRAITDNDAKRINEINKCINTVVLQHHSLIDQQINYEMYSSAFKRSGVNLWTWDIATKELRRSSNAALADGLGEYVRDVPNYFVNDNSIHPNHVERYIEAYRKLEQGEDSTVMVKKLGIDGCYHWLRIVYQVIKDKYGVPVKAIGVGEDVDAIAESQRLSTEKIIKAKECSANQKWFRVDLTDDKIIEWSGNIKPTAGGEGYQKIIDTMAATVVSEKHRELFLSSFSRDRLLEDYKERRFKKFLTYELTYSDHRTYRQTSLNLSRGENGHIYAFALMENNDENVKICRAAVDRSGFDRELGLFDFESFKTIVRTTLEEHSDYQGCIMYIDMDKFTLIIDTFGEEYASEIIAIIVASVRAILPADAILGRIFKDRFAVYIPKHPPYAECFLMTNQIQKSIYSAFSVGSKTYVLSASVGLSFSEYFYGNPDDLLADAERILLEVKRYGA